MQRFKCEDCGKTKRVQKGRKESIYSTKTGFKCGSCLFNKK